MPDKYKLPQGQKLATFKIQEEDWEAFKTLCTNQNITVVGALTAFIKTSLSKGEIAAEDSPTPQPSLNIEELEARLLAKVRAEVEEIVQGKKQKITTTAKRGRS